MIHFMVDFENVGNRGLQGAEYLSAEDSMTIFYSKTCSQVENRKLQQIISAGSVLHLCCLQNTGKNALDFYIASKIGELYGSGYEGLTAVVSKDKGYHAVRDYWEKCVRPARKIVLCPDLEQGIVASNENSTRRTVIQRNLQEVSLEAQYEKYKEHLRIREELEVYFADTMDMDQGVLEQVVNIVEAKKERRVLYLDTLKQFGKKKGLEIYQGLNRWYGSL